MSACQYCGGPLPIFNRRVGSKSEITPWEDQVHTITTTGPKGTFSAEFTHDEWTDKSKEGRAAKDAIMRHIHKQAGHTWDLRI